MAQPSYKVDVLQIEPAATGTRTISRDSTAGELKFTDPTFPSGVVLADLMGLQSVTGVSVVGVGGGAPFTSIQEAINGVSTNPAVVVIAAGDYTEDITISKDVVLVGLGYVRITNASAGPTITITEDTDNVPTFVCLQNLTIECTEDGAECLNIDGSNTFASGTVVVDALLSAGDTVVINGNTLTGISGARTSGSDDFNAGLGTVDALAAEIAAALNDVANSFAADVSASATTDTVTIEAVTPGAGGNAITLSVTGGNMTASGANLTGGGGVDSAVGSTEIAILDCTLLAAGVGTRQIVTQTMNNVRVQGGTWFGSSSTSLISIAQTASFKMFGVAWINDVEAAYDSGNDQPLVTTSEFSIINCGRVGNLITNFIGEGSLQLSNIPGVGDVTINGDRTAVVMGCALGSTLIEDTVVARLVNTTRDSLGGAGTPTVAETSVVFSSALVAANNDTITFDREQPDVGYAVLVDVPTAGVVSNVTAKNTTDFTVTFSAPVTGTAYYTVLRQM